MGSEQEQLIRDVCTLPGADDIPASVLAVLDGSLAFQECRVSQCIKWRVRPFNDVVPIDYWICRDHRCLEPCIVGPSDSIARVVAGDDTVTPGDVYTDSSKWIELRVTRPIWDRFQAIGVVANV